MAKQVWQFESTDRWVRAIRHGETIADSKRAMLLIESRGEQDYYFPTDDVKMEVFEPSEQTEISGYRGTKKFWNLRLNGDLIEKAAWTYEPKENRPDLTGYIALDWKAAEHWYEEEEEVFNHPRNPYHRVDFVPSSRHVQVIVDGIKVADTTHPLMVFETTLPTRYYIPDADVDKRYLVAVDTETHCPYKGDSSYYNVVVNGETYENTAWYYPQPIPEAPRLKGTIAFWPEKDKRIQLIVDGEPV
ncbi:MAG: DUF427 domain-containing protein [Chloroflexota bacterium]